MKETKHCLDLRLFGAGDHVVGTEGVINANAGTAVPYEEKGGLSPEMRTYYAEYLLDNAEPNLVHDQFGQKHPIPKNGGKTIQFRKYDPLPKLTAPLSEGVTPDGQTLNMGVVEATVHQYGGYVEFSDLLLLSAIDNNLVMATKLLGAQAGRTLDTITREVLCGGTNVQYANNAVSARYLLSGGDMGDGIENNYLTVECIRDAVRFLKSQGAERIDGAYVGIVHPDCVFDLIHNVEWKHPNEYSAMHRLFQGEIGMLEGVRFVESTEAKIIHAPDLWPGMRVAHCVQNGYTTLEMAGEVTAGEATLYRLQIGDERNGVQADPAIIGKKVDVCDSSGHTHQFAVVRGIYNDGSGNSYLYFDQELLENAKGPRPLSPSANDWVSPSGAGNAGRDVYITLIMGENAYGTTELTGGGLEHIVKQLGSAGTADPLNQRATVGWKATKAAARLVEAFMVRIETTSSFESGAN